MGLFGVSLMINDGDHFSDVYWQFLYLCEMSKIFAHFKQGGLSHLFLEAHYILNMRLLSDTCFANIFYQFVACFFIFLIMSFNAQTFFILMRSNLSYFLL